MLKSLCADARSLRETILCRVAGIGCHINEDWLPQAEAIVDSKISEFLFAPEYAGARRKLAEGRAGDGRVMTLLALESIAKIKADCAAQCINVGPTA